MPDDSADSVDKATEQSQRRSLRLRFVSGTLLLIALVAGIQVEGLRQSYQQYQDRARLSAQNLGNVLAENIAGAFQTIDLTLQAAVDRIRLQRPGQIADAATFNAAMTELKQRVPWLISLRMTDASGNVIYGTRLEGTRKANLGDRDYFTQLKSNPSAGMVIGTPVVSRISDTWVLGCSRRYNLPNGEFGGMVYGTIEIDGLAARLIGPKIQIGDRDVLTLRDDRDNAIVRYTHGRQDMQVMGKHIWSPQSQALLHSNADSGFYTVKSTVDGIERIYYFRRVPGQSLNIVVGLSLQDAMAGWRSEAWSDGGVAAIFTLIIGCSSILLYRSRINNLLTLIKLEEARSEAEQARLAAEVKSRQVGTLLDNSGQGFLSFGADLRVESEYSDECTRIFSDQSVDGMAGAYLPAMLHPVDTKQRADLESNLHCIFACDDAYMRELYQGLLPTDFKIQRRHYEAQYRFLSDGKMMLILTDVSDERALQEKVREEQQRVEFLVNAMENRNNLLDTLESWRQFEDKLLPTLLGERAQAPQPLDALTEIHRQVHTYKGLFAQEGLPSMPPALHSLEDRLAHLLSSSAGSAGGISLHDLRRACEADLRGPLEADLGLLREKLGAQFFSAGKLLQVPAVIVDQLECDVIEVFGSSPIERDKLLTTIQRMRHQPLSSLLEPHFKAVAQLAARLQRGLAPIRYEGDEIEVDPRPLTPFCKSLVHVFRNGVDHGIEDAETRFGRGKSVAGHIHCRVTRGEGNILLRIGDDGRGLDSERIRERALERGLISSEQAASLDERAVLRLIFADGLSTREQVTQTSGRGVGLAATLDELNKLGGSVEVVSAPGLGTEFCFSLPMDGLGNRQANVILELAGASHAATVEINARERRAKRRVMHAATHAAQKYLQTSHGIDSSSMEDEGSETDAMADTIAVIRLHGHVEVTIALRFEQGLLNRLFQDEAKASAIPVDIPTDKWAFYLREIAAETANIVLGHCLVELAEDGEEGGRKMQLTFSPPVVTQGATALEQHDEWMDAIALVTAYGRLVIGIVG